MRNTHDEEIAVFFNIGIHKKKAVLLPDNMCDEPLEIEDKLVVVRKCSRALYSSLKHDSRATSGGMAI